MSDTLRGRALRFSLLMSPGILLVSRCCLVARETQKGKKTKKVYWMLYSEWSSLFCCNSRVADCVQKVFFSMKRTPLISLFMTSDYNDHFWTNLYQYTNLSKVWLTFLYCSQLGCLQATLSALSQSVLAPDNAHTYCVLFKLLFRQF